MIAALALALSMTPQEPWVPDIPQGRSPIPDIGTSASPSEVVPLPKSAHRHVRRWFNRYSKVVAPNGKPIHILARPSWREDQIVRARNILQFMLSDAPGTRHGADKRAVANAMADRRATLILLDDAEDLERVFHSAFGELELGCQDLRSNECPVEGDADYMAHRTRDAAFEEILHMVQDYGIRPVLPVFDQELHRANLAANEKEFWFGWPDDEPENHRTEYFAAVYDNYLDLWAVRPTLYEGEAIEPDMIPAGCSHFGRYGADSRAAVKARDPEGYDLIEAFFPPFLDYPVVLPADFEGSFVMHSRDELRYTRKSQHLVKVSLSGKNDAHLIGNDWNNELGGNEGDNAFQGRGGDDEIRGGPGRDSAIYRGMKQDYEIEADKEAWRVRDRRENRDGQDRLYDIEVLMFRDGKIDLKKP